jgi:hypothetical protein
MATLLAVGIVVLLFVTGIVQLFSDIYSDIRRVEKRMDNMEKLILEGLENRLLERIKE